MILETQNLSKQFGRLRALEAVDLAVAPGEIFGIAGPNGAGKSTLFNVIAGTFPPTSGRVLFKGREITRLPAHRICHLGLARTFQIPQTFQTLSVYDNIRVGATFGNSGRGRREHIAAVMDFLGLTPHRDDIARNLDLYTTKQVMVAASLATGCQLLMLDEPLAGLSMTEISEFIAMVRRINRDMGITILMIEHLLDTLIEVSHRMLILHNGAVIYTGDPEGVRQDPKVVEVYLGPGAEVGP
jgi:branched-chain amino acid transport system ATP-binding protein